MPDTSNPILIAIEGIDGAGKTTQVHLLKDALKAVGQSVVTSKEPTNGQWGKIIRESASAGRLSLEDELDLFIKDRTEHVADVVAPALKAGKIVILDRYFYSTIAYQGCRGMDPVEVKANMESLFPIPDAVFILDIDPVLSTYRIAHSRGETPNHFEDRENLANARAIFQQMTGSEIHTIDGSASREVVQGQILERFIEGPLKAKRCAKSYGCDDPFHCSYRITGHCEWVTISRSLKSSATAARV